jgi:hypothetical protein
MIGPPEIRARAARPPTNPLREASQAGVKWSAVKSTPPGAWAGGAVTEPPARTRSILTIVLIACLILVAGSLISILCTAIAEWLTGSGYVVTPGRPF